jgi:phosphopantetheinyl transferase (holo-ACP synthase)
VETVGLTVQVAPAGDPAWDAWLSPAELAYCDGMAERRAARVLAKRAAAAAVGWPDEPPWSDLEIRRQQLCGPELVVVGDLREWCEQQGLAVGGISMSHAAGHAAAIAWTSQLGREGGEYAP